MKGKLGFFLLLLAATAVLAQQPEENDVRGNTEDTQAVDTQDTTPQQRPTTTASSASSGSPPASPSEGTTRVTTNPPPTSERGTTERQTTPPPPTRIESTATPSQQTDSPSTRITTAEARRHSTTPRPVPVESPPFPQNVGKWSVKGINSSCIVLTGALQIRLKRDDNDIIVNVPNTQDHVKLSGDCKADTQHLQLNWFSANETSGELMNNTLRLKFTKEGEGREQYALRSVKFAYTIENSTQATSELDGPFFLTTLQHSLSCQSPQQLQREGEALSLETESLKFEAFRNDAVPRSDDFSQAEDCKADHKTSTGTILGIGVAIGLAVVGTIALGTYLCKKCRRGGYQQLDTQG